MIRTFSKNFLAKNAASRLAPSSRVALAMAASTKRTYVDNVDHIPNSVEDQFSREEKLMFERDQELIRRYIAKHSVSDIIEHHMDRRVPDEMKKVGGAGEGTTDHSSVEKKIKELEETIASLRQLVDKAKNQSKS
eukprot:GEZU01008960.1.p1 GENE.GEZU01008960.1~~GEZU01008960.1.p1  ORF type:complete len:135 (+),score=43.08 GEZU01008960.1:179-583(+)